MSYERMEERKNHLLHEMKLHLLNISGVACDGAEKLNVCSPSQKRERLLNCFDEARAASLYFCAHSDIDGTDLAIGLNVCANVINSLPGEKERLIPEACQLLDACKQSDDANKITSGFDMLNFSCLQLAKTVAVADPKRTGQMLEYFSDSERWNLDFGERSVSYSFLGEMLDASPEHFAAIKNIADAHKIEGAESVGYRKLQTQLRLAAAKAAGKEFIKQTRVRS